MNITRRLAAFLLLLAAFFGAVAPATAEPHSHFVRMIDLIEGRAEPLDAAAAQRMYPDHAWPHGYNLTCWNGCDDQGEPFPGAIWSQNHSQTAHAAAGDWRWHVELSKIEQAQGLMSRELGSERYYYDAPIASKITALWLARRAGDRGGADLIRRNLRAIWALDSLTALPGKIKSSKQWLTKRQLTTGALTTGKGLTIAHSGERWTPAEIDPNPRIDYATPGGHGNAHLFAAAIDWKPRDRGREVKRHDPWTGDIMVVAGGGNRLGDTLDPEPLGLTVTEREILQRVVRGDVEAARIAAGWVAEFGVFRNYRNPRWKYRVTVRRTSEGVESIFHWLSNGNKPGHQYTSYDRYGEWRTARAGTPDYVGGNRGCRRAEFDPVARTVTLDCTADTRHGGGARLVIPALPGEVLWSVEFHGDQMTFSAGEGAPPRTPRRPRGRDAQAQPGGGAPAVDPYPLLAREAAAAGEPGADRDAPGAGADDAGGAGGDGVGAAREATRAAVGSAELGFSMYQDAQRTFGLLMLALALHGIR